jgi:hypothetical protein
VDCGGKLGVDILRVDLFLGKVVETGFFPVSCPILRILRPGDFC